MLLLVLGGTPHTKKVFDLKTSENVKIYESRLKTDFYLITPFLF